MTNKQSGLEPQIRKNVHSLYCNGFKTPSILMTGSVYKAAYLVKIISAKFLSGRILGETRESEEDLN